MNYETLTSAIQGGQEEINPVALHDAHDLITYRGKYTPNLRNVVGELKKASTMNDGNQANKAR